MEKKKHMTSKLKSSAVIKLLMGGDIELVSREFGVTIGDLSTWREQFIENGTTGFRPKPDDSRLGLAERKIGQLQMELELTKKKNALVARLREKSY